MNSARSIIGGALILLSTLGCGETANNGTRSVETGRVLPSIQERLTQRVINGTLIKKNGPEYVVKDAEGGVERMVHVDQQTNLDPVMTGETVRIYLTDEGHATTLQRITE